MFRDQRLGEISEDVLDYLSSRAADARIFEADLQADLGAGEDVHEAIEAFVLSRAGPEGGRMHTGRSRNDEVATCIRLALRAEMLSLMDEQLSLAQTLVSLAEKHTNTIIPGFTHTQHAQPTTLAHHLLAH